MNLNNEPKTIDVLVSITLSKRLPINVIDYKSTIDIDAEGNEYEDCDFSNCNLEKAVEEQHLLPHIKFSDWDLDDYVVIRD